MSLENFITAWDKDYKSQLEQIDIFKPELTSQWSASQKQYFARIFYHARGHFHDFLWYVGNHADDKETKDIMLRNIAEELNGSAKSHEQMYFDFANDLSVDVSAEFINNQHHLNFVKEFNHGHLKWLSEHDADERFGAFAAYERLDNIDYAYLLQLVQSLNVSKRGQIFFKVHSVVEHFTPTVNKLQHIWAESNEKINASFSFIAYHQLNMWKLLSKEISLVA
jgi:hypothetical protein